MQPKESALRRLLKQAPFALNKQAKELTQQLNALIAKKITNPNDPELKKFIDKVVEVESGKLTPSIREFLAYFDKTYENNTLPRVAQYEYMLARVDLDLKKHLEVIYDKKNINDKNYREILRSHLAEANTSLEHLAQNTPAKYKSNRLESIKQNNAHEIITRNMKMMQNYMVDINHRLQGMNLEYNKKQEQDAQGFFANIFNFITNTLGPIFGITNKNPSLATRKKTESLDPLTKAKKSIAFVESVIDMTKKTEAIKANLKLYSHAMFKVEASSLAEQLSAFEKMFANLQQASQRDDSVAMPHVAELQTKLKYTIDFLEESVKQLMDPSKNHTTTQKHDSDNDLEENQTYYDPSDFVEIKMLASSQTFLEAKNLIRELQAVALFLKKPNQKNLNEDLANHSSKFNKLLIELLKHLGNILESHTSQLEQLNKISDSTLGGKDIDGNYSPETAKARESVMVIIKSKIQKTNRAIAILQNLQHSMHQKEQQQNFFKNHIKYARESVNLARSILTEANKIKFQEARELSQNRWLGKPSVQRPDSPSSSSSSVSTNLSPLSSPGSSPTHKDTGIKRIW